MEPGFSAIASFWLQGPAGRTSLVAYLAARSFRTISPSGSFALRKAGIEICHRDPARFRNRLNQQTANGSRLSDVDVHEAWKDEARDFTPWLAENIDELSRALGPDLDPTDVEVAVRQFSADIVAKESGLENRVLIEF